MDELKHIGVARRSGRYPWGSGKDGKQRNSDFAGYVNALKKEGMSEVDIAKGMGTSVANLRSRISVAKDEKRRADSLQAYNLKEKGYSNIAIGKQMGINESSVRLLLNARLKENTDITNVTANMLKDIVAKKGMVDVGIGVERYLGVSRTKLDTAILTIEDEGYQVHFVKIPQLGTNHETSIKVLTGPDVTYAEVFKNRFNIKGVTEYSEDGGRSFVGIEPVKSVDSKRVSVRYGDEGGSSKDGVIELRPGVDDISLGEKRYSQVRIAVDGTHYLKGMAMYSDDMPDGVDIIYNTNKSSKDYSKHQVFKKMEINKETGEIDSDNPFGAMIRQKHYIDKDGKKQLSALNIVGHPGKEGSGEEGSWGEWSKNLSSQFLAKQAPSLARKQLALAHDIHKEEYDEIMKLTNPTIRKKLLLEFANEADSAAVHLKAAALPRQATHVILPLTKIKETEVYAPNYENGERVVLVRHPHGGIFEIPELIVNNRNPQGRNLLGQAKDAVGIHPKVAEKLSGADFDGDTVVVIPNGPNVGIRTAPTLKGLVDFDPKTSYPGYPGMTRMTKAGKGMKMGDISNLITDMTVRGGAANMDEITRAIKHSMVVIDAEKHGLDYVRSYNENGIADLKKKYQGSSRSGASTLLSKANSDKNVPLRKDKGIDPVTGKRLYEYTGESYLDKNGKLVVKTFKSKKLAEEDDAFALSSGTQIEAIYATHSNRLKALANQARRDYVMTPRLEYSPSAAKLYANEVRKLEADLNLALMNAPLERQAQRLANANVAAKKTAYPNMDKADLKKVKGMALIEARTRVGAGKHQIEITEKQWEAIQAGAISDTALSKILLNADPKRIKELATPRSTTELSPAKAAKAKVLLANGHTQAEVAKQLGVSTKTLSLLTK